MHADGSPWCLSPVHFGFWIDARRNLLENCYVCSGRGSSWQCFRVKHFQMRKSRKKSGSRFKELHLWRLAQCHGKPARRSEGGLLIQQFTPMSVVRDTMKSNRRSWKRQWTMWPACAGTVAASFDGFVTWHRCKLVYFVLLCQWGVNHSIATTRRKLCRERKGTRGQIVSRSLEGCGVVRSRDARKLWNHHSNVASWKRNHRRSHVDKLRHHPTFDAQRYFDTGAGRMVSGDEAELCSEFKGHRFVKTRLNGWIRDWHNAWDELSHQSWKRLLSLCCERLATVLLANVLENDLVARYGGSGAGHLVPWRYRPRSAGDGPVVVTREGKAHLARSAVVLPASNWSVSHLFAIHEQSSCFSWGVCVVWCSGAQGIWWTDDVFNELGIIVLERRLILCNVSYPRTERTTCLWKVECALRGRAREVVHAIESQELGR